MAFLLIWKIDAQAVVLQQKYVDCSKTKFFSSYIFFLDKCFTFGKFYVQ